MMAGTFKKSYEVVRTSKKEFQGIEIDGKKMKLGRSGAFSVSDPGVANAIDEQYGIKGRKERLTLDDVMVIPVEDHVVEAGHKYTFSSIALPWAKYDALGKRIPDTEEEDNGTEESIEGRRESWRPDSEVFGLD